MKKFHELITFTIPRQFGCHNWASYLYWVYRGKVVDSTVLLEMTPMILEESERYPVLHCLSTAVSMHTEIAKAMFGFVCLFMIDLLHALRAIAP